MITTLELSAKIDTQLQRKIVCPVCLSSLEYVPDSKKGRDLLVCISCNYQSYILEGLPILLIEDTNWQKKESEIEGEVQYNVKTIPPEVHSKRNTFVDMNTELFLQETSINLSEKELLVIGCSMTELNLLTKKSKTIVCLDIVPKMVKACQQATISRNIEASWICGDGECLPFENESFDIIIIRQTLHHMLKYYSAISEFFRICRVGGNVLIIDEPFAPFDRNDMAMDSKKVKEIIRFVKSTGKKKKETLNIIGLSQSLEKIDDISALEKEKQLIDSDVSNPESLLADKYHNFSLLNCLYAITFHTRSIFLSWPREIAWTTSSDNIVEFCHGPNPNFGKPLTEKLIASGNVSIAARKTHRTKIFRKREGIRSISYDKLNALLM